MAQATQQTSTPLSQLFRDPVVAAAFARAERDGGDAFAVPLAPAPVLSGGTAATRELELA